MKFSLRLNNDLPVAAYLELAQIAEEVGFDQFWVSDDLFLRSGPVILTAVAGVTRRIEIGTCILNPYTMHAAEIAMLAATLDEASQGRFNLGLSAGAGDFLSWVGIPQARPRTAVIETIEVINRLFAGERVAYDGQFHQWTDEAYLRFRPARRVPIYVGALSPKMLHAVGQYADGGLPLLFPPEHYRNVAPLIAAGAHAAGRVPDAIDVAACIWCSIGADHEAAVAPLKDKIAYYGHALSPMIYEQLGLTRADFDPIRQALVAEQDEARARALVTDAMLQIGIAGTPQALIPRLQALVDMGARHLSFGPPLGADLPAALRLLGEYVLPHFREQ